MKIESVRFVCSAFRIQDEPRASGNDVVFLGRSNVGKSSLINRLLGKKGLARTSSRPGRTQSVNFYHVNEDFHFVDLPGYGFAKVPEHVRRSWRPMVEGFLERRRESIALALLIIDARHKPSELDGTMRDWLEDRGLRYVVCATKSDKLSGNGRARAKREVEGFGGEGCVATLLVSAESGLGIRETWRYLDGVLVR